MFIEDTRPRGSIPAEQIRMPEPPLKRATFVGGWRSKLFSPLWLCLLLALALRVFLTVHTRGIIDGDEALVGIQAQRILHGDFPVYFYGQAYMGSLEAYLVALLFAIFGSSVWTLRAEPVLLSAGVVWLTWKLAEILTETTTLPQTTRRLFMTIAALCAAFPPLYDGVIEGRTYGGFIEMLIVILLLLISTIRLTRRWFGGASTRELIWRWVGLGFLMGLGFWIYPLIASAVLATVLWILGACALEMWRRRSGTETRAWWQPARELLLAFCGIPTGLIGMAPALAWGATHQWANITYVFNLGGHETLSQKFSDTIRLAEAYGTCIGPQVIGGGVPYESPVLTYIHICLFLINALCIAVTIFAVGFSLVQSNARAVLVRQLAGLPALFAGCTVLLFCASSASKSVFIGGCQADFAGRYAAPLMLALPFFCASAFLLGWTLLKNRRAAADVSEQRAARFSRSGAMSVAQFLFLFALLGVLGVQVVTYQLASPDQTYQSSYCRQDPADNGPILLYLQGQHVHYFWANNMLAYPLVFKSRLTIIGADPLPLIHPKLAINRIPSYTNSVLHADRPALLFVVRHDEARPEILQALGRLNVLYRAVRFPSQPGYDVLVIIPLNRTVSPLASPGLDQFFCVSR